VITFFIAFLGFFGLEGLLNFSGGSRLAKFTYIKL
jgi:hypothetical protein